MSSTLVLVREDRSSPAPFTSPSRSGTVAARTGRLRGEETAGVGRTRFGVPRGPGGRPDRRPFRTSGCLRGALGRRLRRSVRIDRARPAERDGQLFGVGGRDPICDDQERGVESFGVVPVGGPGVGHRGGRAGSGRGSIRCGARPSSRPPVGSDSQSLCRPPTAVGLPPPSDQRCTPPRSLSSRR